MKPFQGARSILTLHVEFDLSGVLLSPSPSLVLEPGAAPYLSSVTPSYLVRGRATLLYQSDYPHYLLVWTNGRCGLPYFVNNWDCGLSSCVSVTEWLYLWSSSSAAKKSYLLAQIAKNNDQDPSVNPFQ